MSNDNLRLESEKVIVAAPLSFAGSAEHIWRITYNDKQFLIPIALILIGIAWCVVVCWYATFGLLVIPYRLIRRSQRKNKRDELRHREMLSAIEKPKI